MNMVSLAVPDADVEETGLRLALRQAAPVFEAALAAEVLVRPAPRDARASMRSPSAGRPNGDGPVVTAPW